MFNSFYTNHWEGQMFVLACITASAIDRRLIKSDVAADVLKEIYTSGRDGYEQNCGIYLRILEEKTKNEKLLSFLKEAIADQALYKFYMNAFDNGMAYIVCGEAYYPKQLESIPAPPAILFIKGHSYAETRLWQKNTITVIGTRKPSDYGERIASVLGDEIAARGGIVVSGLAYGIDALVQKAAVERGGKVIAVLASSLDQVYPSEHQQLFEKICQNGFAISEHPPGSKLYRNYFPARNRIMSGLSQTTVVVESSQRSGTLITVEQALAQGREVWAVPGSIYNPQSKGVNMLIADGAMVLHDFDVFFKEMVRQGTIPESAYGALKNRIHLDSFEGTAKRVLERLLLGPATAEELSNRLDIPEVVIFEAISELEDIIPVRVANGEFILT